jgi:hypothetical protein
VVIALLHGVAKRFWADSGFAEGGFVTLVHNEAMTLLSVASVLAGPICSTFVAHWLRLAASQTTGMVGRTRAIKSLNAGGFD